MNESYAEANAKKRVTGKDILIKTALIAVTVFFILGGLLLGNMIFVMLGIVFVGLSYYFIPRLKIVYEYIFCDGQLDFDKIMGGEKRKHVHRIDFENVVIMAPANSHALDGYRHSGVKVRDFSSLEAEPEQEKYGVVTKEGEQATLIYFEPNEKMLAAIKQKAPRKLSEY